jgi:tRNA threonylcarbamoyladenosine biosynthesis protein TsaE
VNILCKNESDLVPAAVQLLKAHPLSRVFAFYGKMGAGKTTLIKTLCQQLDVSDVVQSPSFSIVNEYKTTKGDSLFHFDFYRINKLDEVFDIGYEEYFYSGSYCFIEWPERIEPLLPSDTVTVSISGETDRVIIF